MLTRRKFFGGAAGFVAAAATYQVTESGILMPAKELQIAPLPAAAVFEGRLSQLEVLGSHSGFGEVCFAIRPSRIPTIHESYFDGRAMHVLLIPHETQGE